MAGELAVDVSHPIRSVIPSVHGDVLAVLARTDVPLTGRGIARLTDGVSDSGVKNALRALTAAGIVLVESHPPANLYRLNRRHLAASAISELATMRSRLIDAMREHMATWDPAPWGAWLFGSTARGDGSVESDVDVLIVRPDTIDETDERWTDQLNRFIDDVGAWTGNACAVVEYTRSEFERLPATSRRLFNGLTSDGIALTGQRLPSAAPARSAV
ncbi:MAG: nucleotidyltransferase domain-containing protein [Microthrixaceae bacterium]|nr:nucleotidyltransferase domain-containing protein [Microthrixaceae bacterium]MCO5313645.1 nucleotidyltransferase domain-containing protein [Microthrixaceae bacterium]HPB45295.1 nucleotidyltransferase domain-containing protein [Microthrixaceae bacterium]